MAWTRDSFHRRNSRPATWWRMTANGGRSLCARARPFTTEKIRAQDAVASIRRWLPRDAHGQILTQRLDDIRVLDDRRFEIRLRRPFGSMLDALGKPWSYPCFIYPERFALIDPATPLTEVVGSGPLSFRCC